MYKNMRISPISILIGLCLTVLFACEGDPCIEIADPDFLIQERVRYINVEGTAIDTFIESEQIKHLQAYKITPKKEWDSYEWTIVDAFDKVIKASTDQIITDSSLQDYQRNIMGYRINFKGTRKEQNLACFPSGEQIEVATKVLRVVPISHSSSYAQGKYEGHNLSNPEEKFTVSIGLRVLPLFPPISDWRLTGLPKSCDLPLPNLDVRYQAFTISNGHQNPVVCGNLEGIGILSNDNNTIKITYNYIPPGETKRIQDTFVGIRI